MSEDIIVDVKIITKPKGKYIMLLTALKVTKSKFLKAIRSLPTPSPESKLFCIVISLEYFLERPCLNP